MSQERNLRKGITAPMGFTAAGVRCGIKRKGLDVALIYSDRECSAAGVFTRNSFKAAPVALDQNRLKSGRGRAIVANSGNANACTGKQGVLDADATGRLAAELLGIPDGLVYVASTGIIGVPMPMDKLRAGVAAAVASLSVEGGDSAAAAILTTDTGPKTSSREVVIGGKTVRIGGMCKGAGMICPSMATMLCFITTDVTVSPAILQRCVNSAVERSFNCLSVDGDMSTNDTVLVLANGASGCALLKPDTQEEKLFECSLTNLCIDLAKAVARDGEGATKFVEVRVQGAATSADAKAAAMSVANSVLVKTAVFGEDPNWGRVLCAAGRSPALVVAERTKLWFGEVQFVENGEPLAVAPEVARATLEQKDVVITLDLGVGDYSAAVFTCDFSYDYVKINAKYHT